MGEREGETISAPGRAAKPATLRQGGLFGGWGVTGFVWLLCAVLGYASLVNDPEFADVARTLALLALLAVAGWWIGAFPRLLIDKATVTVVNLFRTVRIPRASITDISDVGMVTIFTTSQGRALRVRAWGAPGAPKPSMMRMMARGSERRGVAGPPYQAVNQGVVASALGVSETSMMAAEGNKGLLDAEISWNSKQLLLLGFLLVLNVAIWLR